MLAIRGAIINKNQKATDIFAACGAKGRYLAVSNGLLFKLIKECKKRNCNSYDLSGIDPINSRGFIYLKKGQELYQ